MPYFTKRNRPWLSYTILGGAGLTALAAFGAYHRSPPPPAAAPPAPRVTVAAPAPSAAPAQVAAPLPRPRVELVFALDTTGSMSGLIEGAKRKIWSLASFVARGQPTPDLRVGLIGYRDVGDAYVTRRFDLDDDLDRVYARLKKLSADGGGDTPEHVSRALHEAVNQMSWTDRQEVVKVIYLVGDAPPHTDYDDGFDYARAARTAKKKGIDVHTIRCGNDPETETTWRRIAELGRGQFLTIGQDGGMREERSPYDAELAKLNDELTETTVAYGVGAAAARSSVRAALAAPVADKAARVGFMASKGKGVGGKGDLLDDIASGEVKMEALPQAELPAELKALAPAEQKVRIEAQAQRRKELNIRIDELSKKRDAHLRAEAEKDAKLGAADGFDAVAKKTLKKSVADNALSGLNL